VDEQVHDSINVEVEGFHPRWELEGGKPALQGERASAIVLQEDD
jgi:hypothetical protein